MNNRTKRKAFSFMFHEFGKSIWWEPKDLTRKGNPSGNPPDLNLAEAESIFAELVSKELLLIVPNKGVDRWIMHQGKRKEWKRISTLWGVFLHFTCVSLKWIGVFILWASSILISNWLSTNSTNIFEILTPDKNGNHTEKGE